MKSCKSTKLRFAGIMGTTKYAYFICRCDNKLCDQWHDCGRMSWELLDKCIKAAKSIKNVNVIPFEK